MLQIFGLCIAEFIDAARRLVREGLEVLSGESLSVFRATLTVFSVHASDALLQLFVESAFRIATPRHIFAACSALVTSDLLLHTPSLTLPLYPIVHKVLITMAIGPFQQLRVLGNVIFDKEAIIHELN